QVSRTYLIFDTSEYAQAALGTIRRKTAINVEFTREDVKFQPRSRQFSKSSRVIRISPQYTPLTLLELEKLFGNYRGFVSFVYMEDDPAELTNEGKSNKAPGSGRKGNSRVDSAAFVLFENATFAENAQGDITNFTNIVSNFALHPERVIRQRNEKEKVTLRVDKSNHSWIVLNTIPENLSYITLKEQLIHLDGFKLIAFNADSIFVAFDSKYGASKAIIDLSIDLRINFNEADNPETLTFEIPHVKERQALSSSEISIRIPSDLHSHKIGELLSMYPGVEENHISGNRIIARFVTINEAQNAVEDLEKTTNLFVECSTLYGEAQLSSDNSPDRRSNVAVSKSRLLGTSSTGNGPWAIFAPNVETLTLNLRTYFGSQEGFEKLAIFDEGAYVWFKTHQHALSASDNITLDKGISISVIEKSKPRDRFIHNNQHEHLTCSLFIRNVPGLPRDALLLIVQMYPGYVTVRGLSDYIIVDFIDTDSSRAALLDLRMHTNIRVDYSNKTARSMDAQTLDKPSRLARDDDEMSSVDGSVSDKLSPRTIYISNLGSKDKADILQWVIQLRGFTRCQFGQANFRLVMKDENSANEAMIKIKNLGRNMKASFAKKDPEQKKIEELGEPSKVLWTSTLYWNESEFIKLLQTFAGFYKLDFDSAHSWVHFDDVESARSALEFFNSNTNLYSVFSSKKFGPDISRPAASQIDPRQAWDSVEVNATTKPGSNRRISQSIDPFGVSVEPQYIPHLSAIRQLTDPANVPNVHAPAFQLNPNTATFQARPQLSKAIPIINPKTQLHQIPVFVPQHLQLQQKQNPEISLTAPISSTQSVSSISSFGSRDYKGNILDDIDPSLIVSPPPNSEFFPKRKIDSKSSASGSARVNTNRQTNIVQILNSAVTDRMELLGYFSTLPGFVEINGKLSLSTGIYCRFIDSKSAEGLVNNSEIRHALGKEWGGVGFRYRSKGEIPSEWEEFIVEDQEVGQVSPVG
ncbi:hypothetical protein HK096_003881, partial [Nowakowskiella sp. JEL0078]